MTLTTVEAEAQPLGLQTVRVIVREPTDSNLVEKVAFVAVSGSCPPVHLQAATCPPTTGLQLTCEPVSTME